MRLAALRALCQAVTVAAILSIASTVKADNTKPNIIYIVADDLGWKDVGFHGSDIETPNIDKIAAGGVRLEQFYAQPMCTPTRAALMTGRYPFRYGLQTAVIPSSHTYGLPTDEWLLPQALKEAGYQTAIVGKWHLGHGDPNTGRVSAGLTTNTVHSSEKSTISVTSNTECSIGTATTSRSGNRVTHTISASE